MKEEEVKVYKNAVEAVMSLDSTLNKTEAADVLIKHFNMSGRSIVKIKAALAVIAEGVTAASPT